MGTTAANLCYTPVRQAMFGIGFGEMVVIAVLLLVAVGPDKLPAMVKTVAKTYRQFRRTALDIRASTGIDDLLRDEELRELADLRKQKLLAMTSKPAAKTTPAAPAKPQDGSSPAGVASSTTGASDEEAPIPATSPAPRALTYKQRTIEAPLEGVDVFEAERAATAKSHMSASEAKTESAPVPSGAIKANGGL